MSSYGLIKNEPDRDGGNGDPGDGAVSDGTQEVADPVSSTVPPSLSPPRAAGGQPRDGFTDAELLIVEYLYDIAQSLRRSDARQAANQQAIMTLAAQLEPLLEQLGVLQDSKLLRMITGGGK